MASRSRLTRERMDALVARIGAARDDPEALRRELRAGLREMRAAGRDRKLRAGRAKPRTQAEADIFAADLLKRVHRHDDDKPTSPGEPVVTDAPDGH